VSLRLAISIVAAWGCGSGSTGAPAIFPADYAATYQEVRDCRRSLEHAATIRILVSPDAVTAYNGRAVPFPVGSFVLKEEYAVNDLSCAKPIVRYTVMQKLDPQSSTATLDWEWQETGPDFHETPKDTATCVSCHSVCGKAPMGYDGTCAEP
jgi:hypothetical protein